MNFTFGIITDGNSDNRVNQIIDTIILENIPKYEIIIVGNSNVQRPNTKIIRFCEEPKPAWITRKKNLITQNAKYENIVYMHDYVAILPGWYEGQVKFDDDISKIAETWHVQMNRILNFDNTRYRDWVFWDHPVCGGGGKHTMPKTLVLAPYDYQDVQYHYISGAYWISKKQVMTMFPLDERLSWGQGEDVLWSKQIRDILNYRMNILSAVKLLKQKDVAAREPMPGEQL